MTKREKWIKEVLTSQHPRGSPLAASNPADMMVKSGANSEAKGYNSNQIRG